MAHIFADIIFRSIFFNENYCILIQISLKFVPKGSVDYMSALVEVMVWHQTADKQNFEPILFSNIFIILVIIHE